MEKQLFELMTKMYNEIQEMKENMATKEDVKSIKQDIVKLEHKIDEKLEALFDAREVGIDKDAEISTSLQRVETKVDKLELRVLRNNINLPSTNEN
ncbi:MAG: hypothetical protein ACLSH8_03210 [Zhenhengia sp.]|uniref:hypothetical protein n=1 Tax=Zhenhengia sp. TaxID=2944208 RepID=UPI00290EEC86|nr:hypothetical protein [Clostridiales bacterium]